MFILVVTCLKCILEGNLLSTGCTRPHINKQMIHILPWSTAYLCNGPIFFLILLHSFQQYVLRFSDNFFKTNLIEMKIHGKKKQFGYAVGQNVCLLSYLQWK